MGPIIKALADKNEDVRLGAVGALIAIGEPAEGPLIQALKDKDGGVRKAAAWVLEIVKAKKS